MKADKGAEFWRVELAPHRVQCGTLLEALQCARFLAPACVVRIMEFAGITSDVSGTVADVHELKTADAVYPIGRIMHIREATEEEDADDFG